MAAFGDVTMPVSRYSVPILAGAWPSQSVSAWSAYAAQCSGGAQTLFAQVLVQHTLQELLAPMSGAFIDAARALVSGRRVALENRVAAYRFSATKARWAANELHGTKSDLVEIVTKAEEDIDAAWDRALTMMAAASPLGQAMILGLLQLEIIEIVSTAHTNAQARDAEGAATVSGLANDIKQWTQPYTPMTMPAVGGPGGVPVAPAPQGPNEPDAPVRAVDFTRPHAEDLPGRQQDEVASDPGTDPKPEIDPAAFKKPDSTEATQTAARPAPAQPKSPKTPSASAPSPSSPGAGVGSGSSPGSMFAQLMNPGSMTSPSQAMSPASSGATPGASPQVGASGPGTGPTGAPAGAPGVDRAVSAAGSSAGIAQASAPMSAGAISATAAAVGGTANLGSHVAQVAAAAATTANPPAGPAPESPRVGGTPMTMMPPTGAMSAPVSSGPTPPAGPTGPNVAPGVSGSPPPTPVSAAAGPGVGPSAGVPAGAGAAPLFVAGSPIAGIAAGGVDGDVLVARAAEAGQLVVTALVAQTRATGYLPIDWAVSLLYESSGQVSAWLATSEGPSYIPLGVQIPEDVAVALADETGGVRAWEQAYAAGGADPVQVVVEHARARDGATPGVRVLAIASTLPMGRVADWAATVRARAVSLDPKTVDRGTASELGGRFAHRCAVAMPWEWRQANAFTDQERLQIAARHMRMAAVSGRLTGRACEQVMRLFEQRDDIGAQLWHDVAVERTEAMIAYRMASQLRHHGGGPDVAQAFTTSRAAEVVACLQHFDTVEGCADILYASRLAGAPLNPAVAVR
ncbi:hypothetical protein H7J77_01655 [Mycolicibacillus parakoreensis]|uniref:ESX-1 secretion-associated protein EspK n=1 Tax=Mycolicibacillus parakoreensis TaxID=1069221 RepID=A0ABY3U0G0_9MYCO|nr:hypothetical protein [Mycolicibacillus parakoreensis]MCV7314256.1 hypothetical protein [Mycolicibacillus parakoreensis]ULN52967.1 hypothetical protein MIU77_00810 [Mycolicibacillus parakoreensis]